MCPVFFIFGFGYTSNRLADKLVQLGFNVVGTTRQESKLNQIHSERIRFIDFNDEHLAEYLSLSTHVLISIPPSAPTSDDVLSQYSTLIRQHAAHIEWVGYLSSTGVYGDYQGDWVDEESICRPQSASGILRFEAEKAWLTYAKSNQLPLHLFRLAGIYGPGRNSLQRIKAGKKYSIFKEGQVFSRIHVDDLVSVILASIKKLHPFSIYNVADDEPASPHLLDAYSAYLLKQAVLPIIPYAQATLSPMEQEFYLSNRRVANKKIKRELNVCLQYPSYREGLTQIWREDFEQK